MATEQACGLQLPRAEPDGGEGGGCAEAGRVWAGGRGEEEERGVGGGREPAPPVLSQTA